ncbi:hypothetical protein [Streptomyces sp. NPDC051214]|uniref:hypothetical protein n=1 Tax=Streptomyces sp. NPDC051214 TaxID=3155282 RepID=UPI0034365836
MMAKEEPVEEPGEPSRTAGGCVLLVLAVVLVAVVFMVSPTVGLLALWAVGTLLLWRAARRMSVSSATPPPRGVAPDSDIDAARRRARARGAYDPNGVMCVYHAPREEVTETDSQAS